MQGHVLLGTLELVSLGCVVIQAFHKSQVNSFRPLVHAETASVSDSDRPAALIPFHNQHRHVKLSRMTRMKSLDLGGT